MLRLIGRLYRAVGRAVICTCPYRDNCVMFGERRVVKRRVK